MYPCPRPPHLAPGAAQLSEAIADAIRDADLNLNPQADGSLVRVPVPKASKETKEATVKLISKIAEGAKNRVRRVRQAAMEKLKKAGEGVSTDDTFREMKEIEALTKAAQEQVAALADKKKLEVESG
jgi:ribosome recycling factor